MIKPTYVFCGSVLRCERLWDWCSPSLIGFAIGAARIEKQAASTISRLPSYG